MGSIPTASGDYTIAISPNRDDNGTSLPSGDKKIVPSGCCAMIGQVAPVAQVLYGVSRIELIQTTTCININKGAINEKQKHGLNPLYNDII